MPSVHTIGILHQTLRELCIDLNYLMILNFKEVERHALCARYGQISFICGDTNVVCSYNLPGMLRLHNDRFQQTVKHTICNGTSTTQASGMIVIFIPSSITL